MVRFNSDSLTYGCSLISDPQSRFVRNRFSLKMVPGHCSPRHTEWQNGIPSRWPNCWRNQCLTRNHNWIWSTWRLVQGQWLDDSFSQGFCSSPPPQPGNHTTTAMSSFAYFVVCQLSFSLCLSDILSRLLWISEALLPPPLSVFLSLEQRLVIFHILILLLHWVMWKFLVSCLSWKSSSLLLYSVILDIQGSNKNPQICMSLSL